MRNSVAIWQEARVALRQPCSVGKMMKNMGKVWLVVWIAFFLLSRIITAKSGNAVSVGWLSFLLYTVLGIISIVFGKKLEERNGAEQEKVSVGQYVVLTLIACALGSVLHYANVFVDAVINACFEKRSSWDLSTAGQYISIFWAFLFLNWIMIPWALMVSLRSNVGVVIFIAITYSLRNFYYWAYADYVTFGKYCICWMLCEFLPILIYIAGPCLLSKTGGIIRCLVGVLACRVCGGIIEVLGQRLLWFSDVKLFYLGTRLFSALLHAAIGSLVPILMCYSIYQNHKKVATIET